MIIQIDLNGNTVIEKFNTYTEVNTHFDKQLHPRIIKLMNRDAKDIEAHGYLWAKVDPEGKTNEQIESEALLQVRDFILQRLFSTINVYEKSWNKETIEKLIFAIGN